MIRVDRFSQYSLTRSAFSSLKGSTLPNMVVDGGDFEEGDKTERELLKMRAVRLSRGDWKVSVFLNSTTIGADSDDIYALNLLSSRCLPISTTLIHSSPLLSVSHGNSIVDCTYGPHLSTCRNCRTPTRSPQFRTPQVQTSSQPRVLQGTGHIRQYVSSMSNLPVLEEASQTGASASSRCF